MDPVRNPYAPGAGQRPPELTGRDREISQFEVVLERIARGRPERSMVLTGLRGVGKTVLLNTFRSMALQRLWGTGKIEARPIAGGKAGAHILLGQSGFMGIGVDSVSDAQQCLAQSGVGVNYQVPAKSGALVCSVYPGTPAAKAGLAAGD